MKQCVGFQRQMIGGNMLYAISDGHLDIVPRFFQCLAWQSIHQVEIHVVEVLLRDFDSAAAILVVVYAAK